MFKWFFHILIFATSGKYQNKEKPLKRQKTRADRTTLSRATIQVANLINYNYYPQEERPVRPSNESEVDFQGIL